VPGGLHVYDGQNHQVDVVERRRAVLAVWDAVAQLRDQLVRDGYPVPRIVAGATGSFPIFAGVDDRTIEVCPGTCIFHDVGYDELFRDLGFGFAALVLTRVISRPTHDRVTLDLGYKAVASDSPPEKRLVFPEMPDAHVVLQNEEHLVIETSRAANLQPGDALLAIPRHACPTSALHKQAFVVRKGKVTERWDVAARDRWLTI
jgi:D-serine deaminase-like pyridoxal phosphate-dependent protein